MALTGVGVTFPIIMLIAAFSAFAGMGGAPLASIQLGKHDYDRAELILGNSAGLLVIFSVVLTIAVLLTAHISYDTFYEGAKYLSYLLTPATVCLAVPLYEKLSLLKSNWKAIFAGILSGVITTLCSVFVMSKLFHLTHEEYVTLLPKSITTAVGMGVSEELGGYVTLTVAMIIITGIFGNVIAVSVCRLFRITDPIAKGVSIGSAAHALGTAKALEIGEVEGAMSSLSIVVAGLLTVVGASIFANLM